MEQRHSKTIAVFLPTALGCILALLILILNPKTTGESKMGTTGWIAIAVALLGVAGSVLGVFFQMKRENTQMQRDGKTIDSISESTTDMNPRVEQIQSESIDIRKKVSENMIPMLSQLSTQDAATRQWLERNASAVSHSLKALTDELEFQQRLKKELSARTETRDSMVARLDLIYSENARLSIQTREQETEIAKKDHQIFELENQLKDAREEDHERK